MKQRIPAVILMFALFLSTSFAANAYKKSIEVEYGIDVEFNGQQIAMADATGKPVDAFVYQGTTYVPIRAISETFGADVGYDSSTNTAYVYDDFSEICAVVNAMSYISSSCYNTILLQMATMGADTASDMSAELNTIDEQVDNMYDTLSFLTTEDGYNVNISIITEDILPSYGTFLLSYRDTATKYTSYIQNPNSTNWNAVFDSLHKSIDDYNACQKSIMDFYSEYCLWRDLGIDW